MKPWFLAALALAAAPVRAQVPPGGTAAADDITDWESVVTPTGPVVVPNTPEGAFSNPEGIRFTEQTRRGALDQVCRGFDVAVRESVQKAVASLGGGVSRSLKPLPTGQLALVDEVDTHVGLGRALWERAVGAAASGTGVTLSVSAGLDGTSFIVRPLPSSNACEDLKRLVNVTDIKTVVPLSGERISQMEIGELWKMPLALDIGAGPAAMARYTLVSFGWGQQGSAMMTLYRLADDQVRFRLRINHVRIKNAQGDILASYPAVQFFGAGVAGVRGILERAANGVIAHELSDFITGELALGRAGSDGQQIVMEFVLDPRDPEQMARLAGVMKGDLRTLAQMAARMSTFQATVERAHDDFVKLEGEHEEKLGSVAAAPGIDLYHQVQHPFRLRLPLIFDHSSTRADGDDKYISLASDGDQVHIYHAEKTGSDNYLNIPIKGALIKRDSLRSAQAFVRVDAGGSVSEPQAVYIYHEGFLRKDASDVREMAQDVSRLITRIGADGGPGDARLALPVDRLVPPQPPRDPQQPGDAVSYHSGSISLTLVLTAKAVADIVKADAAAVARSLRAVLDEGDARLLDFALQTAGFDAEGRLRYDQRQFYEAFGSESSTRVDLERVCGMATGLVADLADIARQPDREARAKAIASLISGGGRSGLAYERILEVLVQLAAPRDVTADFRIDLDKKVKGDPDAHAHLVLHKDRPDNPGLKRAGELKQRFATPSDLVD